MKVTRTHGARIEITKAETIKMMINGSETIDHLLAGVGPDAHITLSAPPGTDGIVVEVHWKEHRP